MTGLRRLIPSSSTFLVLVGLAMVIAFAVHLIVFMATHTYHFGRWMTPVEAHQVDVNLYRDARAHAEWLAGLKGGSQ